MKNISHKRSGQYRNAVASGRCRPRRLSGGQSDPTLPRYGTDFIACVKCFLLVLLISGSAFAQTKPGSHASRAHPSMSAETKALLEEAIGVVCTQAKLDPKSSVAIDEMQARPSLPLQTPEARDGAERAQRLLPLTKNLMIAALEQLFRFGGHVGAGARRV